MNPYKGIIDGRCSTDFFCEGQDVVHPWSFAKGIVELSTNRRVPVAEYSMPQFVQADLDPLWLRVLSHRHPRSLHLYVEFQIVPD